MTKQEITRITIECRHGSGHPVWNIMMFVEPSATMKKNGGEFTYKDLVSMAESVLRNAKDLRTADGWVASNADVMAWSGSDKEIHLGIKTPHQYRVTLDMENSNDNIDSSLEEDPDNV